MVVGSTNADPVVYVKKEKHVTGLSVVADEYAREPIDRQEVFHHIRDIKDPERPCSLEELKVVSEDSIEIDDEQSRVRVFFTPTVGHCRLATFIGLCIRVKLMRSLPSRFKVDIFVAPGTHEEEVIINKLLNDKECVATVLENFLESVEELLSPNYQANH